MKPVADELRTLIETSKTNLLAIPDSRAGEKPYADKWSLKEIVGHLVDSAANNHQRIVRMQEMADIGTLVYSQLHWVGSQRYQDELWEDIVGLWYLYNKHLAHIIAQVDEKSLNNMCDMGYDEPASLRFVIEDYVRHVRHHLDQILSDADPRERRRWIQQNPSQTGK